MSLGGLAQRYRVLSIEIHTHYKPVNSDSTKQKNAVGHCYFWVAKSMSDVYM